jgi:hypothetical protein
LQERKVIFNVDFIYAVNREEFLASVDDDQVVVVKVRGVVERVRAVLDEVGVEWTLRVLL